MYDDAGHFEVFGCVLPYLCNRIKITLYQ